MAEVRIATFNVENLFARFRFTGEPLHKKRKIVGYRPYTPEELDSILKNGWTVEQTFFQPLSTPERKITGEAIKKTQSDVIALQEVEGMATLKKFNTDVLAGRYREKLVITGMTRATSTWDSCAIRPSPATPALRPRSSISALTSS